MKLGIISSVEEDSFRCAAEKGLDFVEFCINAGYDTDDFFSKLPFLSILYAKNYARGLSIEPHSSVWQGELGSNGVDYTISYMKSLLL